MELGSFSWDERPAGLPGAGTGGVRPVGPALEEGGQQPLAQRGPVVSKPSVCPTAPALPAMPPGWALGTSLCLSLPVG